MTEYHLPVSVIPSAHFEWERMLPAPGQVLVNTGDRVEAMDLVARALQPGALYAVNAARELGVGNAALPRYMVKTEGEDVRENEVLASRGGLLGIFRKKCVSPVSGTIVSVIQGRILVEQEPLAVELRAYVRGVVSQVVPNYGVTIQTTGALIRGVWASADEAYGIVRVIVDEPDQPLTPDLVDSSCHGAIVVGGRSVIAEALEAAEEVGVRALVTGGFEADLVPQVHSYDWPVVVTQGMGEHPMLTSMFRLFRTHQGREAAIMNRPDTGGARITRPEILIPVPAERDDTAGEVWTTPPLQIDSQVVVMREPYMGSVGRIKSAPKRIQDDSSGLAFWGVEVSLDEEGTVSVPLTNLNLIENDVL